MGLFVLGLIVGALLVAASHGGGRHGLEGDITKEQPRRPKVQGGYQPDVPPVDWAKVKPPPSGTAAQPPRQSGIIPGRPGQEVNSGGDTFIPPLRPGLPRREDRDSWELLQGYPPDRSR